GRAVLGARPGDRPEWASVLYPDEWPVRALRWLRLSCPDDHGWSIWWVPDAAADAGLHSVAVPGAAYAARGGRGRRRGRRDGAQHEPDDESTGHEPDDDGLAGHEPDGPHGTDGSDGTWTDGAAREWSADVDGSEPAGTDGRSSGARVGWTCGSNRFR